MKTAKQSLQHCLALAYQGASKADVLAEALADFLTHWPEDGTLEMREAALSLLEMALRDADPDTRTHLAARLGDCANLPLTIANEFYLSAPRPVRHFILERNQREAGESQPMPADAGALLEATRNTQGAGFTRRFAGALHLPVDTAAQILADPSAEALAVACRGAHVERAHFSAMALLKMGGEADMGRAACLLSAFDAPPQHACESLTGFWQNHGAA